MFVVAKRLQHTKRAVFTLLQIKGTCLSLARLKALATEIVKAIGLASTEATIHARQM